MAEVVPRLAATVLVLRDGHAGLEVFMVRRHHLMGFAGDALVFPGGRLDAADAALAAKPNACAAVPGADRDAMALRVAALRETFEEAGILLARRGGAPIADCDARACQASRPAVADDADLFAGVLAAEGLVLATDLLVPFAHWITPPIYPKRYDTMFYLAEAPEGQGGSHDGEESVDSLWTTPADALAAGAAGTARVEFATRRNLEKIGRAPTVAAAIAAARAAPIVTVLPDIKEGPRGRIAHLPGAAGYGATVFDFT